MGVTVITIFRDISVSGAALFLVWRVAFAAAKFAETQAQRTKIEGDMLELVRDFIETQRETNKQLGAAIAVHARRLNAVEERLDSGAGRCVSS